jgi:hypothetical protein
VPSAPAISSRCCATTDSRGGYDGPEGKGAGKTIASFAKTPLPRGLLSAPHLDREPQITSRANPKGRFVSAALLVANHRAVTLARESRGPTRIRASSDRPLGVRPPEGAALNGSRPCCGSVRGWSWIHRGRRGNTLRRPVDDQSDLSGRARPRSSRQKTVFAARTPRCRKAAYTTMSGRVPSGAGVRRHARRHARQAGVGLGRVVGAQGIEPCRRRQAGLPVAAAVISEGRAEAFLASGGPQ